MGVGNWYGLRQLAAELVFSNLSEALFVGTRAFAPAKQTGTSMHIMPVPVIQSVIINLTLERVLKLLSGSCASQFVGDLSRMKGA